jgi:hypothetical protein
MSATKIQKYRLGEQLQVELQGGAGAGEAATARV